MQINCTGSTRIDAWKAQCKLHTHTSFLVNHWHVLTWLRETHVAWYQKAAITGREVGAAAGRNLCHWIIEYADCLQPIKVLILSTELFCLHSEWSIRTRFPVVWSTWNLHHTKFSQLASKTRQIEQIIVNDVWAELRKLWKCDNMRQNCRYCPPKNNDLVNVTIWDCK